jgi:hypothetical protein
VGLVRRNATPSRSQSPETQRQAPPLSEKDIDIGQGSIRPTERLSVAVSCLRRPCSGFSLTLALTEVDAPAACSALQDSTRWSTT